MEFLVAGACAVQIGTANFYDPTASMRIAAALPIREMAGLEGRTLRIGCSERDAFAEKN